MAGRHRGCRARGDRVRQGMDPAAPQSQHPAGRAVRLPPGVRPGPLGLRRDSAPGVGAVPAAGAAPAERPARGGVLDLRRPRQGPRPGVPRHPPRDSRACARRQSPLAVARPPRLRRRRLEAEPATPAAAQRLPHPLRQLPLPAGPAQLPFISCALACRSTSTCPATATSAPPR